MVISPSALVGVKVDSTHKWNLKLRNFLAIITGKSLLHDICFNYPKPVIKFYMTALIYFSKILLGPISQSYSLVAPLHCIHFRKYNVALSKLLTRLGQAVPKWLAEELRES